MAMILLIDDDEDIRDLVTLRLEIAGHEVSTAENGKLGLEKAIGQSFDIVLMDMHMPVMSGHEAVEILRSSGYAGLIIALTASSMTTEINKALRSGCDQIIVKPIFDTFEKQIAEIIDNNINI